MPALTSAIADCYSPWQQRDHWRLNLNEPQMLYFTDRAQLQIIAVAATATDATYSLKLFDQLSPPLGF